MTLLVVAAWEPELERFRAVKNSGIELNIGAVGIGPVDAALGTARLIAKHAPKTVLLLGTAGATRQFSTALGAVIVATETRLVDGATVEGRAAMPYASEAIAMDAEWVERFASAGATKALVANTLGITTNDELADKLAAAAQVEHLEAYGVARACEQANVRCAIVLGISNLVGSEGRAQWRANHLSASAAAGALAARALSLPPQG